MAHEVLEQGELARPKIDGLAGALHTPRQAVQPQVGNRQLGGLGRRLPPARDGLEARQQLGEGEGLGRPRAAAP
jgi:hypothetical protein